MAKQTSLKDLLGDGKEIDLKNLSFEDGLKLLEELVSKVESGALPLDSAIMSYEQGARLIEQLKAQLNGAEEKLRLLQRAKGPKSGE